MQLAYLGPEGSHSEAAVEAVMHQVGKLLTMPKPSLGQILEAVETQSVEVGCVPVENALEGSVGEVLDTLAMRTHHTRILAEFIRPIHHALIRVREGLDNIQFIHSHPQALGQCRETLYTRFGKEIHLIPAAATSEAVRSLLELDETHAALGTVQAAQRHGLKIVLPDITLQQHNATRFLLLTALQETPSWFQPLLSKDSLKTSLCVGHKENRPGALLEVLTILARYHLNMTKIESRPAKRHLGEYLFYFDVEGAVSPEAEQELREVTDFFKCMGTYPALGVL